MFFFFFPLSIQLTDSFFFFSNYRKDDYKVEERRKPHLKPYDLLLKSFRYKDALDAVLQNQRPIVVMALLEELSHRDALRTAISGRDDIALEPLLTFLVRKRKSKEFKLNKISPAFQFNRPSMSPTLVIHRC